jgi:hypothetical protein
MKACDCICKCLGFFNFKDWSFDHDQYLPTHFKNGSIQILYRDKIKVFYNSVAEAKDDNYKELDEKEFKNSTGYVHSYTGLRGDAKNLYRKI